MHLDEVISLLLALTAGGVWTYQFIILRRVVAQRRRLGTDSYDGPPRPAPKLSVLVAAKDEEANIEACIESLLAQDYPDVEIVAIDDRSRDATPQILARLERQRPDRIRVVTVSSLPVGWQGKSHAMHLGASHCGGEWLLFTDADCRFTAPNALSIAMRDAIEHDVEFLSITPFLETRSAWERVVQPVCALVLMLFFVPGKVNDPKRKTAYANGAFMLIRRACYDVMGGHQCVQGQVNEDIQLARTAKRMAIRLRVAETEDLYRTRMYATFRAAWAGWSRILYGSLQSMERLVVAASVVCFFSIGPWLGLVLATIAWASRSGSGYSAAPPLAWLGVVLVEQAFLWRVYRLLSVHPFWSLSHVLGAFAGLGIIINAMRQFLGSASLTWRGTTYRRMDDSLLVTADRTVDLPIQPGSGPGLPIQGANRS